jgi:hypothetical protein
VTPLSKAIAAWQKQPRRARQVAIAIMRGEAFFALTGGDKRGEENRSMFNAALRVLRAAEKPRKVRRK